MATDIYKPQGAWKLEPNFTTAVNSDGQQETIEYARPIDVPHLMGRFIEELNAVDLATVNPANAHLVYARFHMAFVHIHPFWDGNGRRARLVANFPILRAGLPPLTIPNERRRQYIEILADYQLKVGRLTATTGLIPEPTLLHPFAEFCDECFTDIRDLVAAARDM